VNKKFSEKVLWICIKKEGNQRQKLIGIPLAATQAAAAASSSTAESMVGSRDENRAEQTELTGATFVFMFLYESRNEYRNTRNKYENEYF
jgi:hypothetical protein